MTWSTQEGIRVLSDAERKLIAAAIGSAIDMMADAEQHIEPRGKLMLGDHLVHGPFEHLEPPEQYAVLHEVCLYLFEQTDDVPTQTAVNESAIYWIFRYIKYQIEEMAGVDIYGHLVIEALKNTGFFDEEEEEEEEGEEEGEEEEKEEKADDEKEEEEGNEKWRNWSVDKWDLAIECLADRILWDRDFEMFDQGGIGPWSAVSQHMGIHIHVLRPYKPPTNGGNSLSDLMIYAHQSEDNTQDRDYHLGLQEFGERIARTLFVGGEQPLLESRPSIQQQQMSSGDTAAAYEDKILIVMGHLWAFMSRDSKKKLREASKQLRDSSNLLVKSFKVLDMRPRGRERWEGERFDQIPIFQSALTRWKRIKRLDLGASFSIADMSKALLLLSPDLKPELKSIMIDLGAVEGEFQRLYQELQWSNDEQVRKSLIEEVEKSAQSLVSSILSLCQIHTLELLNVSPVVTKIIAESVAALASMTGLSCLKLGVVQNSPLPHNLQLFSKLADLSFGIHLDLSDSLFNPDLSPISLCKIQDLNLSGCPHVNDETLSTLAPLSSLHTLDISHCHRITTLASLSGCPALTKIVAFSCPALTTSSCVNNSLELLNLSFCPSLQINNALLGSSVSLTHLELKRCPSITDLLPLAPLQALQSLDLTQCTNLTSLKGLPSGSIKRLNLQSCKALCDLNPLSSCIHLLNLDISFCHLLSTLSPLQGCSSLETVDFSYCKGIWSEVEKWKSDSPGHPFSPLGHCTNLRSIIFNGVVGPDKLLDRYSRRNRVLTEAGWGSLRLEELICGQLVIVGYNHPWSGKIGVATSGCLRPWSGKVRIQV